MRSVPPSLASILSSDTAHLARLFTLRRKNMVDLHFTDCDSDIIYSSITYRANLGFSATDISASSLSRSQTLDVTALDGNSGVNREDIMALNYEDQIIEVNLIDFRNTSYGVVSLFRGKTTDIAFTNDGYNILTFEGFSSQSVPFPDESFSPRCRNELGDAKCGVDIEALGINFTVATLQNNVQFTGTSVSSLSANVFPGLVKFTSGSNNGLGVELRGYLRGGTTATFSLWTRTPYPINIGDTLRAYPGCQKTNLFCRTEFNNLRKFRGEPYLPSSDVIVHPVRKTVKPATSTTQTGLGGIYR